MLRQLINVVRYVLAVARKHIKPLILIVSFVVFVWLIVDTAHRPEFVRHASRHRFKHNQTERWHQRSMQRFLDLLGIDLDAHSFSAQQLPLAPCQPTDTLLFTALAGRSPLEHMWQYFSLIALQDRAVRSRADQPHVRTMLTGATKEQLRRLFASVPMEVIDVQTIACYDIAAACVLGDYTDVEVPKSGGQLYILNNNAMRLHEILEVAWEDQAAFFETDADQLRTVSNILASQRQRAILYAAAEDNVNVHIVGISVDEDDGLPFEYYLRAITFQRKMLDSGIVSFLVLCENMKSSICGLLYSLDMHITTMPKEDDGVNFALMTLCNHTIVSSERDIFPALLRGKGNTVVYGQQAGRRRNAGLELANYKDHWYTIV